MVISLNMIGRIEVGFAILCPVAAMRSIGSGARTLPLDPHRLAIEPFAVQPDHNKTVRIRSGEAP
jgi:hypothetical protein